MLRALGSVALLLSLAVLASGCLIETTVDAKGGGTLKADYRMAKDQTLDQQKQQFTSASMSVTKAEVDKSNNVHIEAKYTDITKLNTAPMFKNLMVATTSDDKAGTRTITAKQVNRNPAKLTDPVLDYFGREVTFSITVPGEIVKSNATEAKGSTATWKMALTKIYGDKEVPFEVTYKPEKEAAGTPAATAGKTPAKK